MVGAIASLFFAYRIFIKKRRFDAALVKPLKHQHLLKDALIGTFFFFTGCSLFACTLTDVPGYLHRNIKGGGTKNETEISIPFMTNNEDRIYA